MPPSLLGGEKVIVALSGPVAVAITFNGGDGAVYIHPPIAYK